MANQSKVLLPWQEGNSTRLQRFKHRGSVDAQDREDSR